MMYEKRDWNDPQYKEFRQKVLNRDGNSCMIPSCGRKTRLQVHHIKTWGEYPALRFEVSNGITLCRRCHENIKGRENEQARYFYELIKINNKNKNEEAYKSKKRRRSLTKTRHLKGDDFYSKYLAAKRKGRGTK